MSNRLRVGCWLFIGGSLLFVGEAIADLSHHISLSAIIHLSEGLLFFIGSIFFLPKTPTKL